MIDGVSNTGAIPALERLLQFSGARHRIIANNVANISTPNFRPVDVSVEAFQESLGAAIDRRRTSADALNRRQLELRDTGGIQFDESGVTLTPEPIGDNILFHDGNDRDPERLMQSLVENFMTFRTAADLIKGRFNLINTAIRERL